MKIGIVGYRGAGKSSLFQWLTGVAPDLSISHSGQAATAIVPDSRVDELARIYQPKKITQASLNIVDTVGLSRDHEGSAGRLALIREAGCLAIVVGAYSGANVEQDLQSFEEDLLIADLDLMSGRVQRLTESVKKPRPNREQELAELDAIKPLLEQLESGIGLHQIALTPDQETAVKSFQLLTKKPRIIIVNTADDHPPSQQPIPGHSAPVWRLPITLQLELEQMDESEAADFCKEMEIQPADRGAVLRSLMDASGQMLFFTAAEKEVRTWMIAKGTTAVDAAGSIHTDLARGFVRAERMTCDDLIRLGSERAIKAQNLMTREAKNYVVQEGDILHILAST